MELHTSEHRHQCEHVWNDRFPAWSPSCVACVASTVKPVLSGHRIKRTSSIKRTVAEDPKIIFFTLFTLNESFIKSTPLLSGRRHLKRTSNSHFYRYQPVLNGHL